MERWQHIWDKGKNGRSTHDVIPKVMNKGHNWPRQLTQFITGHSQLTSTDSENIQTTSVRVDRRDPRSTMRLPAQSRNLIT
ncbi:hypothetical protein AVEN_113466-1 [Araneus ventricosus]|uniref:Uncharacterized protein n=1 Tax=Araneus ventricosus TaxID=182803 RepID=A0A4Y2WAH3_ARAVE|nr:hypothetical protein AVEN_113466-1 [Araneus ventricosus]